MMADCATQFHLKELYKRLHFLCNSCQLRKFTVCGFTYVIFNLYVYIHIYVERETHTHTEQISDFCIRRPIFIGTELIWHLKPIS
jgi:hypothetical protein